MIRRARQDPVLTKAGYVTSCNSHKALREGVPMWVLEEVQRDMEFL